MKRLITATLCVMSIIACSSGADMESASESKNLDHEIVPEKEMMITDFSVIESPTETTFDPSHASGQDAHGAWTFGRLIYNMLPKHKRDSQQEVSKFVFHWLHHWETDQQPNTNVSLASKRIRIREELTEPWKLSSGCSGSDDECVLDMTKVPFRLTAIVYRPDLRIMSSDRLVRRGGEGRFVFSLRSKTSFETEITSKKMTVIFEFGLPIDENNQALLWAKRFHSLGTLSFGKEYNKELLKITNNFSGPGQNLLKPNNNALDQLRTNENRLVSPIPGDLGSLWELREFHIQSTEFLEQVPVAQDPSRDFDVVVRPGKIGNGTRSAELADFLINNSTAIFSNTHVIPNDWLANSSFAGGAGANLPAWGSGGVLQTSNETIVSEELRHAFALQTCGGCHRDETKTAFLHITDRRTQGLPTTGTPEGDRQTLLSQFVKDQISAPSGERFVNFANLLKMNPSEF